jgi:hypothetical protein
MRHRCTNGNSSRANGSHPPNQHPRQSPSQSRVVSSRADLHPPSHRRQRPVSSTPGLRRGVVRCSRHPTSHAPGLRRGVLQRSPRSALTRRAAAPIPALPTGHAGSCQHQWQDGAVEREAGHGRIGVGGTGGVVAHAARWRDGSAEAREGHAYAPQPARPQWSRRRQRQGRAAAGKPRPVRPPCPSPIYAAVAYPRPGRATATGNNWMKERRRAGHLAPAACLPHPWIERLQHVVARAFPMGSQATQWQPTHRASSSPSPLADATAPSPSRLSPSIKGSRPSKHGCYAGDVVQPWIQSGLGHLMHVVRPSVICLQLCMIASSLQVTCLMKSP